MIHLAPEGPDRGQGLLLFLAGLGQALQQPGVNLVLVVVPVSLLLGRHLLIDGVADEVLDPDQPGVGTGAVVEDALIEFLIDRLAEVVGDLRPLGHLLEQVDAGEGQGAVEDLLDRGLDAGRGAAAWAGPDSAGPP